MSEIRFGTSGWRAIIADQFTFERVELVTQAIADVVKRGGGASRGILIAYDTRFRAEAFARAAARVLLSNRIPVFLTERDAPTPVVSFTVRERKFAGSINFTASHNPPEYQGMKFNDARGRPASPELTRRIEARIRALSKNQAWRARLKGSEDCLQVRSIDPRPAYLARMRRLVDLAAIRRARLRVGVDCLYGTGRGYLDELLREAGARVSVLHGAPDPSFGGRSPSPSKETLAELGALIRKEKLHLGLATDGDADRFGIVDERGALLSANEVIALLFEYLVRTRGRGAVARSIATSHWVDAIARANGAQVLETPVGFKYLGELIDEGRCLLAAEESGGLSIRNHLPEKDGILACLLVAEMAAREGKPLSKLLEGLRKRYPQPLSGQLNQRLGAGDREKLLRRFAAKAPAEVGGLSVVEAKRQDGVQFILEDGSWLLVRFSGTEPLVRCAIESDSPAKLRRLEKAAWELLKI